MRGLTKSTKNIITAKKVDQTSNFFFLKEVAVDES